VTVLNRFKQTVFLNKSDNKDRETDKKKKSIRRSKQSKSFV
jgi:hypothetical protein